MYLDAATYYRTDRFWTRAPEACSQLAVDLPCHLYSATIYTVLCLPCRLS